MNTLSKLRHAMPLAAPLLVLAVVAMPARGTDLIQAVTTIPAEKQVFLDRLNAEIAAARAAVDPNAKGLDAGVPAADPPDANVYVDPHFVVGSGMVVQVTDPPPGDTSITVSNLWSSANPGLIVYAGADSADAKIGVVVISHGPETDSTRLTVTGHGALRVSGGDDLVLLLDAEDGAEFKLDLVAEALG